MTDSKSKSSHILELSRELLDDIELSRLPADALLLKCSRLDRLAGSDEIQEWIRYEMSGYNATAPISLKYMTKTGRWTDYEKQKGYWGPLAQQQAGIDAQIAKMKSMNLPSISSEYAGIAINNAITALNLAANAVSTLSGIQSRVLSLLHSFVAEIYYEREFSSLSESIFERNQTDVDRLISGHASDVIQKIPSVIARLSDGDDESISQALATCRRILESFADSIYPPTADTIVSEGNTLGLGPSKHQNRINAFIISKTNSSSRRKRLRQNLSNLFDRVSIGVHNDVSKDEALSLFLNVYLFLGEVLQIPNQETNPRGDTAA